MNMKLIFPTIEHKQDALAYRQEHLDIGEMHIHGSGYLNNAESFEGWLGKIQEDVTRDDGRIVPATTYFAIVDGKIVGMVNIRHKLNDFLINHGGHVGYGVRPNQRRKGYATKILALALEKCRGLEIDKVLVTCDKGNIASAKTIINNGGVFENEHTDKNGEVTRRYWITL